MIVLVSLIRGQLFEILIHMHGEGLGHNVIQ